jgi:catechol 2,3-dioxygenase-like lactoylglutathione lyase family enzyme
MHDPAAPEEPGIGLVTLVVRDYDDAIEWFTRCLRFVVIEDTDLGGGKRWVRVTYPGSGVACSLQRHRALSKPQPLAIKLVAGLGSF